MEKLISKSRVLAVSVINGLLDQSRAAAHASRWANRMKISLLVPALTLLASGCAGNWANYNYGPGDWLSENTALRVDTLYNYEHFIEPTIAIHHVESLDVHCGTGLVQGCAVLNGEDCDIYVGIYASRSTIAHEERHCRGWTHYRPRFEMFATRGANFKTLEIERARAWYPSESIQSMLAIAR